MSNPVFSVSGPINLRIEEAFVALLRTHGPLEDPDRIAIVAASDRDATVPPMHVFVYCDTATPRLPTGPIYIANVAVALVTDMDDQNTAIRKEWFGHVLQALSRCPQAFENEGVALKGWSIVTQGETSAGRQTADVARLSVGVHMRTG
ncbi:hypothetical protein OpiT1DRAFT_05615 [Opitutaceae bacterium TAV1]|nr:hypothetical protein OpiT1DRAFT_05615 [Opitutaceae bacterium TAV1]